MKATGERWERRRWRIQRPERVAAVGERGSRIIGDEDTGHRNRNSSKNRGMCYNGTKVEKTA